LRERAKGIQKKGGRVEGKNREKRRPMRSPAFENKMKKNPVVERKLGRRRAKCLAHTSRAPWRR